MLCQGPRAMVAKCPAMKDNPTQPRMISLQRPVVSLLRNIVSGQMEHCIQMACRTSPVPLHPHPHPLASGGLFIPSSFSSLEDIKVANLKVRRVP